MNIMEEPHLAKSQIGLIRHSGNMFCISLAGLISTFYFLEPDLVWILAGIAIGGIWAFLMPVLWKKNKTTLNFLLASPLVVITPIAGSNVFQTLSTLLFVASLVWLIRKKSLLLELKNASETQELSR